jgi:prenyltransferase beta subunit
MPLGYEKAIETQREVEGLISHTVDFVDKSIDFTLRSWDQETGGFFDSPPSGFPQRADVRTTHSAYLLLWNLERSDSVKQGVHSFLLERCLKKNTDTGAIGFADHPKGIAETSPTYYALRILELLGEHEWIEKHKPGIITFLKACWQEKTGGFGVAPSFSLTLVSTSHALEIFWDILHDPGFLLEPGRMDKIQAYVDACQSLRYGGFRLRCARINVPQWREVGWFSPDLYMTRHMVRIAKLPRKNNPGPTAGVIALDPKRVGQFIKSIEREDYWPAALRLKESGIVKLIRKTADFLLKPGNTRKDPLINLWCD